MPKATTAPHAAGKATFKFFTGKVKAFIAKDLAGEEQYYIEGIASSSVRDRHGDTITAQAQAQMLEQAKGLTMFGNHDYDVPEDVYGVCEESHLEASADIVDLAIRMRVAKSNPRAMQCWDLINKDGVTLAFSIGGGITEAEIDEENDDGYSWFPPLIINGIELYEISLVGIPANPRAYTRSFLEDIARGTFKSMTRDEAVRAVLLKKLGFASVEEAPPSAEAVAADATATPEVEAAETPAEARVEASTNEGLVLAVNVDTSQARDEIAALAAELDQQISARDALKAEVDALLAQRAATHAECEALLKTLAELKATPTGRQSKTATSGGSSGNGTALIVDLTKLTADELLDYKRKLMRGELGSDVRFA